LFDDALVEAPDSVEHVERGVECPDDPPSPMPSNLSLGDPDSAFTSDSDAPSLEGDFFGVPPEESLLADEFF
jgi:hypothetical protein